MSKFDQYLIESDQNLMVEFINKLGVLLEGESLLEAEAALPFMSSTWNKLVMELDKPELKDKQNANTIAIIHDYLLKKKVGLSGGILKIALDQLEKNPTYKRNAETRKALDDRKKESPFDRSSNRASDYR